MLDLELQYDAFICGVAHLRMKRLLFQADPRYESVIEFQKFPFAVQYFKHFFTHNV